MATLVLTVVGTALGGPIGGAIGAVIGQQVDRDVLFKPKGRQGPRLTDLAVQVSTYGAAIPKIFGTIRVAGTVIWATDLIETQNDSGGGKDQPDVTSYSYSASFAVLLSARAIKSVGRIWADGNLLRGVAGDFKTSSGFRLYLGGEDQTVDPLIASAEGALAPAHRGCAYAVFEHLQLVDFGNRIPSLTFEVIADEGAVAAGAIAEDLSGGLIDGSGVTLPVPGFSAYGDSVRGAIETLVAATGARFVPDGGRLAMVDTLVPERAIADAGYAAADETAQRMRSAAAIETVPRSIVLGYYDPARDYQLGLQRARRPGAGRREERVEMPAALSADTAKTIAEATLARAEAGAERRMATPGWGDLTVRPGACVTIDGAAGIWRVSGWSLEKMVLQLDLARLAATTPAASASPGRSVSAPDVTAGETILHAFEIPALGDALLDRPRLTVAAAGTEPGWRRATLLYSVDGGAHWTSAGATAAPATIGVLASVPGVCGATIRDLAGIFEVDLAHEGMMLAGADDLALDAGANLALAGDELLQFGAAQQIGPKRWRLSKLLRGRRGTEAAAGAQTTGDRFVPIAADRVTAIDLPLATIGAEVQVIASGIGDSDGPVSATAAIRGTSVIPPFPVHLSAALLPDGDAALQWVRRSRAGWRWIDGVDAPLGEERELYRVTIDPASGPTRTLETEAATMTLAAIDRTGGAATVTVRQVGSHGESAAAILEIPPL